MNLPGKYGAERPFRGTLALTPALSPRRGRTIGRFRGSKRQGGFGEFSPRSFVAGRGLGRGISKPEVIFARVLRLSSDFAHPSRYSLGNFHGARYSGTARRAASASPRMLLVLGSNRSERPSLSASTLKAMGTSTLT